MGQHEGSTGGGRSLHTPALRGSPWEKRMRLARSVAIFSICALSAAVWADTMRSDLPQRQELKRADLTMSPMNLRDVPHAGFTVVGDQPLRLLTVHIVDKNKPLYEWVK